MKANRSENIPVAGGKLESRAARFQVEGRDENPRHTRRPSALDHRLAVLIKFIEIKVTVGVCKWHGSGFRCQVPTCLTPDLEHVILFDSRNFQAIFQDGFDFVAVRGLAVDPHDRLGAAESDEQPATIFKIEFEPIHGDQFGHF